MIVGLWKRILSDILDALFLMAVSSLLSLLLGDWLLDQGSRGAWFGLSICFLYTGLLQSRLGQGQSLAKKLLGIQVLALDGSYLSLPRSFLRYAVIAFFAYSLAWEQLLASFTGHLWASYFLWGVTMVLFLGCFLMVPLHPLKRGLHDLVAGSIVVRKGTFKKNLAKLKTAGEKKVKLAYAVYGASSLSMLVLGGWFFLSQAQGSEVPGALLRIRARVAQETAFSNVKVLSLYTQASRPDGSLGPSAKTIEIKGQLPKAMVQNGHAMDREVDKVVALVIRERRNLPDHEFIRVSPTKGLSIGILDLSLSMSFDFRFDGTLRRDLPKQGI
jgi:uncharacterized RDD family membrane protein YckC